jgi:tripartite-type tricarboxylate transporter receptor subunit TctC
MKLPHRRKFLHWAAGATALPILPRVARAQGYPNRPVRIVVGFPAGGTADIGARLIGQRLSERLGQQFIVENRPGAATTLATEIVVRAPADGHTLLWAGTSNAVNATLYDKLNYNFIRDFAMVAGIVRTPLILVVHPAVPVNTVPELIAYAKANPGKLSMASFGAGTVSHVAIELFKMVAGVDIVHVPYRGSAPMVVDLLGGQVQASIDNLPTSIEHIKARRLKPLAVTTAARSSALPDVPSVSEFLSDFEASAWNGVAAPGNTPADIVDKLNREINAGLADAKIRARIAELGGTTLGGAPADFRTHVTDETESWGKVIRAANIKPD